MRRTVPWILVVAFAAAFFAPELFGGRVLATANMARWLPWGASATPAERSAPSHNPDSNTSYYPRRWLLHEAWRQREMPLWNPWSFAGTPLLADPQAGVLYPPNWLLPWFEPGRQLGLFVFLHAAWGGLGIAVLLSRCGVPVGIAAASGCAFVANGFFAKHFGQPPFLASASWLPWVLAAAIDLAQRPRRRGAALLALAGSGSFLAGQPQIAMHGAYAGGLAAAVVWARRRAGGGPAARAVRLRVLMPWLLAAALLAVALVAAQLLPTLELSRRSARADLPWPTVLSGAFHPVDALRFAIEEVFGSPLTGDEWAALFPQGDGFYLRTQLNSLFAGTPILLLALRGMTSRRTRAAAAPFTAVFVVAGLVAFGTPVAHAAWAFLPGFSFARLDRAGALLVVAQFGAAGLAAADLATGGRARRAAAWALAATAIGVAALLLPGAALPERLGAADHLDPAVLARVPARVLQAAAFAALSALAWLAAPSRAAAFAPLTLAALQLFLFASPYRADRHAGEVFAPSVSIERLRAVLEQDAGGGRFLRFGRDQPLRPYPLSSVLPPSTNVPYRLRDLQGYNALADRTLGETLERATGEDLFSFGIWSGRRIVEIERRESLEHPLLDALAVRAVVGAALPAAGGWEPLPCEDFSLSVNREALPRVRLTERGRGVARAELDALIAGGRLDPAREVLWLAEDGDEGMPGGHSSTAARWEILADSWNRLDVRTESARGAVLVVADSWDPGWQARVDGVAVPIRRAWGVARAVVLGPGAHRVEMRYVPPTLRLGVAISLAGVVLVALALLPSPRSVPGRESPRGPRIPAGTL